MSRIPINIEIAGRKTAFALVVDNTQADANTMHCLQNGGCCEPEVAHVMARVLREGDTAVDIGANIGFFTLLMSRLVGKTGKVVAFEPFHASVSKLRENIKINQMRNVDCRPVPLWDKQEPVTLYLSLDSGQNSLAKSVSSIGKQKLLSCTFDAECPITPTPRLVKMDVEGAEENIVFGGGKFLHPNVVPYIVSELNDAALQRFNTSADSFRLTMSTRGYETFLLRENGVLPALVPRKTKLVQGQNQNINVLFSTLDRVAEAWPEVQL